MVPHCGILRAISLARLSAGAHSEEHWCKELHVEYPVAMHEFDETYVDECLSPGFLAKLRTTSYRRPGSIEVYLEAAALLRVSEVITVNSDSLDVTIPESLRLWREDTSYRMFLETSLLAKVPLAVIMSDIRDVFQFDLSEDEVLLYGRMFADPAFTRGQFWAWYVKCIGAEEATFKFKLLREPHDYVRWRLGIPVSLPTDRVIDRLVSDAYYADRLLHADQGPDGTLSRASLDRIKMERDTIIKALALRMRREIAVRASTSSKSSEVVHTLLAGLSMGMAATELPTLEDLSRDTSANSP